MKKIVMIVMSIVIAICFFPLNSLAAGNSYGFILPLDNMNLTSNITAGFRTSSRPSHKGIDIAWSGIAGTPVKAVKSGTVIFAGWDTTGGGNTVMINHGGLATCYAHMRSLPLVKTGQQVSQGQVIGYVGTTGNSTGNHLHFEVRTGSPGSYNSYWGCSAQNPITYLKDAGGSINPPPPSQISISVKSASNITKTNATINATVNNPGGYKISAVGFQIGTTSGSYNTTKTENANLSLKTIDAWYDLNKWWTELTPNTKYYYRFFAVYNGSYYYSVESNLKTLAEPVSGIQLNKSALTLKTGATETLTCIISPSNASDKSVTWNSSNNAVATVSNGKVTGINAGNATITAKSSNGKTASCSIKVEAADIPVTAIKVEPTSLSLKIGEQAKLRSYVKPANTTNPYVVWSSNNTSVATVTAGLVTGINKGSATITVKSLSSGLTATCKVTVTSSNSNSTNGSNQPPSTPSTQEPDFAISIDADANSSNPTSPTPIINDPINTDSVSSNPVIPTPAPQPSIDKNGWIQEGGLWMYYTNNIPCKGWVKLNDVWYFLDTSTGAMKTGWQQIGSVWYYMRSSGAMATSWIQSDGLWYYMRSSGAMATGWIQSGGSWYYMRSSGAMITGWQQIGGTWYWFDSSGVMATGSQQIGSKIYQFSSSGSWIN